MVIYVDAVFRLEKNQFPKPYKKLTLKFKALNPN